MDPSLSRFIAQYFQLVDPWDLQYPAAEILKSPTTQKILFKQMFDEEKIDPVPPQTYRTRVLKTLISQLEQSLSDPDEDEIDSDLLNAYSSLMTQARPSELDTVQQLSHVKYTAPTVENRSIITTESRGLILSSGTTGFRTWEAALCLATFLSTPAGHDHIRGNRVVELGAGTGLLSMYCAKYLGATHVLATDGNAALMETLKSTSFARNGLDGSLKIRAEVWEWGEPLELDQGEPTCFDVALGADVTYDTDIIPLLATAICELFTKHRLKEFILSATIRNEDTFEAFLHESERRSLKLERVPFSSPPFEDQNGFFHKPAADIRIYRITSGLGS